MDIGLFAYWWVQVLGTFHQRPISETGLELWFAIEIVAFVGLLGLAMVAIAQLVRLRGPDPCWLDDTRFSVAEAA